MKQKYKTFLDKVNPRELDFLCFGAEQDDITETIYSMNDAGNLVLKASNSEIATIISQKLVINALTREYPCYSLSLFKSKIAWDREATLELLSEEFLEMLISMDNIDEVLEDLEIINTDELLSAIRGAFSDMVDNIINEYLMQIESAVLWILKLSDIENLVSDH